MNEEVDNGNKVYKWYEQSMVRIVSGTKSPDTLKKRGEWKIMYQTRRCLSQMPIANELRL